MPFDITEVLSFLNNNINNSNYIDLIETLNRTFQFNVGQYLTENNYKMVTRNGKKQIVQKKSFNLDQLNTYNSDKVLSLRVDSNVYKSFMDFCGQQKKLNKLNKYELLSLALEEFIKKYDS